MVGSGVDPGSGDPTEAVNGVPPDPPWVWPGGAVAIGDPARAIGAEETRVAAAGAALLPMPLAPATAARNAPEPPALLEAGVDEGRRSGVIAPRVAACAVPGALDPPRGGKANPPAALFTGCQG